MTADDGPNAGQIPFERRRQVARCGDAAALLEQLPASLVFARLPVPLLLVQRSATISMANPSMAVLVGETLAALSGRRVETLIPELAEDGDDPVAVLAERAGRVVALRHRDGYVVHARVSPSVLLRSDDPFSFVAFDDVTERLWSS
jgi:PAS domain S-box-containing protein